MESAVQELLGVLFDSFFLHVNMWESVVRGSFGGAAARITRKANLTTYCNQSWLAGKSSKNMADFPIEASNWRGFPG